MRSNFEILPKQIPHNPHRTAKTNTQKTAPLFFKPNIRKAKKMTKIVCKHIIENCVTMCDVTISVYFMLVACNRSKIPLFRSVKSIPEVLATDIKNIILKKMKSILDKITTIATTDSYVNMIPGATKSRNEGFLSP